jgi:epoxyqueuosine reductase
MLIVPGLGTNVLLGALLLDGPKLRTTTASTTSSSAPRCGRCTACMDRCPTRAFVAPYVLDARRCISYLTIEHAGPIPRELRPLLGHRVFGCDVCQDVCPYNRTPRARQGVPELATRPAIASLGLVELLELGSKAHRRLSRDSAFERISRNRLARNAAIALGNSGHAEAAAPLARALSHHVSSLVRSHAAWALGELPAAADAVACPALAEAGENDPDVEVREEAGAALGKRRGTAGTT